MLFYGADTSNTDFLLKIKIIEILQWLCRAIALNNNGDYKRFIHSTYNHLQNILWSSNSAIWGELYTASSNM